MTLTLLADESLEFPPLENALTEPDGLLAVGGDLSPERLEAAYRHGCFPWFNQDDPILWWSPDPRMVLFPEKLHVSRSMLKLLKKSPFEITFDKAFVEVIKAMQKAYITMHNKGLAHSVEVWAESQLVGGLYGLSLGRLFFGESMFSRISNASKIGFIHLVYKLRDAGVVLIDCQMHTSHLQSLGAELIARHEFADYLQSYQNQPITIDWHSSGIVI